MSVAAAASSGSRRAALEAIRDRLAAELDLTVGKDAAPVARELRAVLDALDALGVKGKEPPGVTDLAAFAATRSKKATG